LGYSLRYGSEGPGGSGGFVGYDERQKDNDDEGKLGFNGIKNAANIRAPGNKMLFDRVFYKVERSEMRNWSQL
jgi:hypothetical protein